MASLALGPIGGIIGSLITKHAINQWAKLLVSLIVTSFVSGMGVTGSALMAGTKPLPAIGAGMVASAVNVAFLWYRSKLTKGVSIALPQNILDDVQSADHPVIEEGKGK